MSPKKLQKDKLTLAQEAYITILWMQEREYTITENLCPQVWVTGNYFVLHLGVHWKNYHRKLMTELVQSGWMTSKRIGNRIHYSLTDLARFAKNDQSAHAKKYLSVDHQEIPF